MQIVFAVYIYIYIYIYITANIISTITKSKHITIGLLLGVLYSDISDYLPIFCLKGNELLIFEH